MKREEKLLKNKNMDMPPDSVLDKAKAEFSNDNAKRKINYKRVVACSSILLAILIIAICIPMMIPHNSAMEYVTNDMLTVERIGSIADYNDENKTAILHFDERNFSDSYVYDGKVVFLEEVSTIDNTNAVLLIELKKNSIDRIYQKPERFNEKLLTPAKTVIGGFTVFYSTDETDFYATFSDDDFTYYIKLSGEISDWELFLKKLIN